MQTPKNKMFAFLKSDHGGIDSVFSTMLRFENFFKNKKRSSKLGALLF